MMCVHALQMGTTLVQLQKLTARHCPNISFSQVHGFDSLRELDLAGCDAFTSTASVGLLLLSTGCQITAGTCI